MVAAQRRACLQYQPPKLAGLMAAQQNVVDRFLCLIAKDRTIGMGGGEPAFCTGGQSAVLLDNMVS